MTEKRTITVRGPLSEDDLARIIAVVADIEDGRSDETFEVFIDAADMEGEAEALMEKMNPLRPGYERILRIRPK